MLERVRRKGNPLTVLVAIQISTAIMENSMEISFKKYNLLAICMSSLEKYLFKTFAHFFFLVELFVSLILRYINSCYILEFKPLSVASFVLVSHILNVAFSSCL